MFPQRQAYVESRTVSDLIILCIRYFGEIGRNSKTLVDYFVRNGAPNCPPEVNPAEYMLETIGAAPGAHTEIDWPATWKQSPEYADVQKELESLRTLGARQNATANESDYAEFAASFWEQMYQATKRTFQQLWRSPSYIYSKALLCVVSVSRNACDAESSLTDYHSPCSSASPCSNQKTPNKVSRTRCLECSRSCSS